MLIFGLLFLLIVGLGAGVDYYLLQDSSQIASDKAENYLLTLDDISSGVYKVESEKDEEDGYMCSDFRFSADAHVSTNLRKSQSGSKIKHDILFYENKEKAKKDFKRINKIVFNECNQSREGEYDYTISRLSFPNYGDDSFAFRASLDGGESDNVLIQENNAIIVIFHINLTSSGQSIDSDFTQELAEKAMDRLP